MLTYLKLARKPAGLLLNFNVPVLKDGVKRILNPSMTQHNDLSTESETVARNEEAPPSTND